MAAELFPDAYRKNLSRWWCGYDDEEAVIWDDFKGHYPYRELLTVLDRYPLQVEVKNGSVNFAPKIVVFTSNFHPRDWYDESTIGHTWEDSPLKRRLDEYGAVCCMDPVHDDPATRPVSFTNILGVSPNYVPVIPQDDVLPPAPEDAFVDVADLIGGNDEFFNNDFDGSYFL